MPTTFSPWARSMPATTEESTPPDMATAIGLDIRGRQLSEVRDRFDERVDQCVDFLFGVRAAERETNARAGLLAHETDGEEDVRWFGCAAGTSRAARYGETSEIERDEERITVDAVKADVRCVADAR